MADARLIQLARLFGLPREEVTHEAAAALVHDNASTLAEALFVEAMSSDDVVDIASALSYLDERLEFLAPYVDAATADVVRAHARERAVTWSSP